ncbi:MULTISPECIES: S8 family serine peptidase [Melioribacter]|uniref:S8 family serine peptidase n=1 Tax=Melioribacter TaxID=1134403 RepID=UPI00059C2CE1|nr:S8 family serine peptidase [Melioribacter roseus]
MYKKLFFFCLIIPIISMYAQNDPLIQYQWNLNKIMAQNAWNITTGSPSIIIAILDNGIDSNHPDLQNKLVIGYDVIDNDNTTDPYGNYWHGTACAGAAAAGTNNGIGIASIGYNCKIMPIQIAHDDNINNPIKFVTGLNWAVAHGADIICFSGHTDNSQDVLDAIDYAMIFPPKSIQ